MLGDGGLIVNSGAQTVSFDILPDTSNPAPIAEPILVAGGGALTLSGVVGGAMGLHKRGAGTLILGAANTYTGITEVDQGVLDIRNSRMKDFYDIWFMANTWEFEMESLQKAIEFSFRRRGTSLPQQ